MIVFLNKDCPQQSDLWWTVRRGVPTASRFNQIITAARADSSSQAEDYACELVGDLVCQSPNYFTQKGHPVNTFAVQNGIDQEPLARRWYSMESGLDVQEVGFCLNDDMTLGCSPDGLIGLQHGQAPDGEWNGVPFYKATCEGGLELKVPLPATQAKYLMRGHENTSGSLLRDYIQQVHGQLIVTGAKWVELCSFSGGHLDSIRIRVEPNEYTEKVRAALKTFLDLYATAKSRLIHR